jgi:serine/threonine-protein kinase
VTDLRSNLQLFRPIGRGHFGEVWLGADDVHGQVAVKVFTRMAGELDADWHHRREGLLAEAQKLSRAQHANVVGVHHLVRTADGESVQMCMEFCSGGSLQAAFDRGPMPIDALRQVAMEVTLGLQSLHLRGMLHRDIKPANILIDDHGVAMLGDFGLVTDDIILGYASRVGYVDHLAIEVINGQGTSIQSDIWALGMTIYRLLHGKAWYEASPPPATRIGAGGFARALAWLPHVPQRWRRAVRALMADDRETRPRSTDQVLRLLADLPISPVWACTVAPDLIEWRRDVRDRRQTVRWVVHSARRHEWTAVSEPLGAGRPRRLGGSDGEVARKVAVAGLEEFFASQT